MTKQQLKITACAIAMGSFFLGNFYGRWNGYEEGKDYVRTHTIVGISEVVHAEDMGPSITYGGRWKLKDPIAHFFGKCMQFQEEKRQLDVCSYEAESTP